MKTERLRTVLLGAGKSGKLFYDAIAQSSSCKLEAVLSSNGESARCLAQDGTHAFLSVNDDWLAYCPDLVVVASPHRYHFEQTLKSLEAGSDVIVDKPAAISSNQLSDLIDASARTVGNLYCGFTQRCNDEMTSCREFVQTRSRAPCRVSIDQELHRTDAYYASWKGSRAMAGGGVLLNQAIHALDLASYIIGAPVSYVRRDYVRERKRGIETTVRASYRAGERIPISLFATTDAAREVRQEIVLEYEDGTSVVILGSEYPSWTFAAPGAGSAARRTLASKSDAYGPAHVNLVDDVTHSIQSSARSRYRLEITHCLSAHAAIYQTYRDQSCQTIG